MKELDQVFIESINELRDWLQYHFESKESVWLVKWKKGFGPSYLGYNEIVDELICFGWVDSLPRSLNTEKTMLRISPRNPKSNWSQLNKDRVVRLTNHGRMKPQGLKLVKTAQENGAWDFLNDVEALILPPDLLEALGKEDKAHYYYQRFPDSSKRSILEWIKNAKQSATRAKRIQETVNKARLNIKANHPKGRDQGPEE